MFMVPKGHRKAILATLVCAAVLAGCSTPKVDDPGALTSPHTTPGTESAKRGAINVSVYDRGNIPPEEGNWDKNRWVDWINKNGPVDVKYTPVPRWESFPKFNALFASGSAPDLILEYDANYRNSWYSQKLLMPIDEMVDKYSTTYKQILEKYPLLRKIGTKEDGKLYEIGRLNVVAPHHRLLIREDWLEKLNLQVPTTTEELYNVANAFVNQDPDGNGKKDTFGINLSGVGFSVISHIFGRSIDWAEQNGAFVHDWDRLQASVEFQKRLFDNGLVDKDFLTDKNGQKGIQDFMNGKLGIFAIDSAWFTISNYETLKKNNPTAKVIPIALPKSQFGQFSPIISTPVQMVGVVNAKAKDPKAIMQYIDWMVDPEHASLLKNGIEGTHSQKGSNGCLQPIDTEKNKKELYTDDLNMMRSDLLLGKCAEVYLVNLRPEVPTQKELLDINLKSKEIYINKDRPVPSLGNDFLPVLPDDLQAIVKSTSKSNNIDKGDIWLKALVGGSGYTAQQAVKDAKDVWEKAGGKQVDDYYAKWYENNKTKIFSIDDLYKFAEQSQNELK
ncbi:extracellular solute-binding protein [Paenibacillus anseongense]|uniref:extracellular solute-binding protein n=1 Tax=Paenibacillus anseongense TaxID=2682845 RepID=UPI002DBCE34C|nr:extracellular solute-binding protein [Paenibacillus anseongense]MEC0264987.1 extracellular solute-binding protein [Paenibacillus anseongense]